MGFSVILSGMYGHMGREVLKLCENSYRGSSIVYGIDPQCDGSISVPAAKSFSEADTPVADCVIDFSHHSCTGDLVDYSVKNGYPLVIATTGQTPEEKEMIFRAAERIPVFFAANYSLGIALLIELAKKTAASFPDAEIEIVEKHHDRKIDAPSGTALAIADAIRSVRPEAENVCGRSGQGKRKPNDIGIHAIRMGNIVGEHEVIIGTQTQTITLKHEAHSRALFAEGAVCAAEFLCGKPAGMYSMNDLVSY